MLVTVNPLGSSIVRHALGVKVEFCIPGRVELGMRHLMERVLSRREILRA
ncbi:MAG: hypothetical protein J4O09_11890 [Chloroflexi bacterium]|nr:hypothetical protein [Chloroflexota bacterium]